MNTLAVIVRAYQRYAQIPVLVHSFLCQTNQDWSMYIVHDGPDERHEDVIAPFADAHANIHYFQSDKRYNDWGHSLTHWALTELVQDESHVLMTNDDNYYVPVFVQYMSWALERAPDAVMVAYDCIHDRAGHHNHNKNCYGFFTSYFEPYRIDLGGFITNTAIAREVGFNSRINEADAVFLTDVLKAYPDPKRYVKLNHALFVHN